MQTIWEARFYSSEYLYFIFITCSIILLCIIVFLKYGNNHTMHIKLGCIAVIVLTLCINIFNYSCRLDEWKYAKQNLTSIEGSIDNYVSEQNGAESFSIGSVSFSYPVSDSLIGYDLTRRDFGHVIKGNGQYVRITYYCQNGVNIIYRIDEFNPQ